MTEGQRMVTACVIEGRMKHFLPCSGSIFWLMVCEYRIHVGTNTEAETVLSLHYFHFHFISDFCSLLISIIRCFPFGPLDC